MSVEHPAFPNPDEAKQAAGFNEAERPAAAKIGEVAAELVKRVPPVGGEWVLYFEPQDKRSIRVSMPTFDRMASGDAGDTMCQVEVSYPQIPIDGDRIARVTEIWSLSTGLELGYTPQASVHSTIQSDVPPYTFSGEEARERVSKAVEAETRGEDISYRRATDAEEGEVLKLLEDLKASGW